MLYHMLAFQKNSAGTATLEDIPGVQDDYATLQNNHYILPSDVHVLFAYGLGASITNAQLNTPYLRSVAVPAIVPLDIGVAPTSLPAIDWVNPPYTLLKKVDETGILSSNNAGAANQQVYMLGVALDLNRNVPQGDIITLRATASITAGNLVWGSGTMTFDQTLPYGDYDVVGFDAVGANLIAARLLPQGGGPRPGVIARQSNAVKPDLRFRNGNLGRWFTFNSTAAPSVQLFGSAAPTTQTFFLDVIKRS